MSRTVRVVTVNSPPVDSLHELVTQVADAAGGAGPVDLVVLPETCRGDRSSGERWPGRTVRALGDVAASVGAYVAFGVDHTDDTGRHNSAVLLDRSGVVAGRYDKRYPYWPELERDPPILPGVSSPVFHTDFGEIGFAICFDVNFPPVWADLAGAGAEMVVWPSAYAGGRPLRSYAALHHYYVLTCTQLGTSRLYNPIGADVDAVRSVGAVTTFEVGVDTGFYHENFNTERMQVLLSERGDDVELVDHLTAEQWLVLRARRPGVSARDLARAYGLEELRDYVARSRAAIDAARQGQGLGTGGRGGSQSPVTTRASS